MNFVTKLFGSIILYFIFCFFVWFIIAFLYYEGNLSNVHLDVEATFSQLDLLSNNAVISGDVLPKTFSSFRYAMNDLRDSGVFSQLAEKLGLFPEGEHSYAFNILTSLIDPLTNTFYVIIGGGYIIVMALEIILLALNGIMGLYEFLVNPIFIVTDSYQAVLEKAKDLFGFAFQGVPLLL